MLNSTATPSSLASSRDRSAVMPCGSPFASLITNSPDIFGANTMPARSLPVGMSSFMPSPNPASRPPASACR